MVQIKDIVRNNLCTGCGVCVSEQPEKLKMIMTKEGFFVPQQVGEGTEKAVRVCPFNPNPDKDVLDEDVLANIFLPKENNFDKRVGRYIKSYAGYSIRHRDTSSSGGLGTYFFEYLLKNKIVEKIFVVAEDNGSYAYQWFDDVKLITKTSKTRYLPVTLEKLFLEIDSFSGKVAVSGVPSFIKAIRLKQYYHPEYKEKIAFLAGIICGGLKSKFYTDYLAQKAGINGDYSHQEYRIKDGDSFSLDYSFGAKDKNGNFKTIKMSKVGNTWGTSFFNSPAYDFSDDLVAELADVSLGDAWIKPYLDDGRGNNVIVTRSYLAEQIVKEGLENGDLIMDQVPIETFKASQAGGFKHKQLGMKQRINLLKTKLDFIPYKRSRLLENTPLEYTLVQKQRLITRDLSTVVWLNNKDVKLFDKALKQDLMKLNKLTRFYHLIQRIKNKLGMRTI
ncbi:MAG: Coenzyme F420 hydrogenase/dehydrogenase, beta subunit C-terminal domain [Pseudomonadota bacterium]|nr:Coenzyme F420 hydrogenase/dehydrogenase, beta subunit C-terminal domain [Pseudomonadota bacterium]